MIVRTGGSQNQTSATEANFSICQGLASTTKFYICVQVKKNFFLYTGNWK